jgi:transcriptional regulator with XRE-family HTH domain
MRERDRAGLCQNLDDEMRPFRQAAGKKDPTPKLLRNVRMALGITAAEMAAKLDCCPALVYRLERSEAQASITLKSMDRMARAMGCVVIYGIVPMGGKTLENIAQYRMWKKSLKLKSQNFRRSIDKRAASKLAQVRPGRGELIRMRRSG